MMNRRCRRCFCMNNNNPHCVNQNMIEKACDNNNCPCNMMNYNENCNCGFDDDNEMDVFPENPMLAQSYVPIQFMDETFKPCVGLENGTIFPELISPYFPGDSMKDIEFLRRTNSIGEGCNIDGRR